MDDPRKRLLAKLPLPPGVEPVLVDLARVTPVELRHGLLFVVAVWSAPARLALRTLVDALARVEWRGRLFLGDIDDIRDPAEFHRRFDLDRFELTLAGAGETLGVHMGGVYAAVPVATDPLFLARLRLEPPI